MVIKRLLQILFDPWVIFGAFGFGILLLGFTLFALWSTRTTTIASGAPTAVMKVLSLPSATATSPSPTVTATILPTDRPPESGTSGNISVGAYVQIAGTGGDGLRLRAAPGLSGEVLFLGLEAEVFEVQDGPKEADGYTWWYLVAPFDESRTGWAVSGYLSVVQNP